MTAGAACGGTMALMLPPIVATPGYGQLGIQLGVPTLTKQAQDFGYALFGSTSQYVPQHRSAQCRRRPPSRPCPEQPRPSWPRAPSASSTTGRRRSEGALVAAGLANGGVIMTPHLMAQITDSQGNVVATYHPTPMLTAATPAAAAAVTKLMQSVADDTVPGATANGIFPVSWHVAVKTGTAQVQAPTGPEETDDWMIGFMPAIGTPQIAIAVVVPSSELHRNRSR